jgi:hypothetical protein
MARITKRFVDAAKPGPSGKEVTYWDETLLGFGLRVQHTGSRAYIVMYRTREGRLCKFTIGTPGKLTPDEAREEARQRLAEAERGGDPAAERKMRRQAMTISELCDWYLQDIIGWVKPGTIVNDRSRIKCHVKPLIGKLTVLNITTAGVIRMQADIANGATARGKRNGRGGNAKGGRGAAARVLSMFATILQRAKRNGLIKENVARDVKKVSYQETYALSIVGRNQDAWRSHARIGGKRRQQNGHWRRTRAFAYGLQAHGNPFPAVGMD